MEISSRWTFTGILNFYCDLYLDHNGAIQSFHKTIHLMMMCQQTKFTCKRINSSDNILQRHILIILSVTVTLTLKTVIPLFHRTILLMMLYYQTKFGCKPTSSLEATTEIVIVWLYKPSLWPWHWTQWTNFSAQHFGLWCCITIPGLATKC